MACLLVSWSIGKSISASPQCNQAAKTTVSNSTVSIHKDLIAEQKVKDLLEPTFYCVNPFELSYYRNQVIHMFVEEGNGYLKVSFQPILRTYIHSHCMCCFVHCGQAWWQQSEPAHEIYRFTGRDFVPFKLAQIGHDLQTWRCREQYPKNSEMAR